jgi:hypothetical protein
MDQLPNQKLIDFLYFGKNGLARQTKVVLISGFSREASLGVKWETSKFLNDL